MKTRIWIAACALLWAASLTWGQAGPYLPPPPALPPATGPAAAPPPPAVAPALPEPQPQPQPVAPAPPAALPPAGPVDFDRMDRDARATLESAHAAVDAYVRAADDAVQQQLNANPDDQSAHAVTEAERRRLEDARALGRPEGIRHAAEAYNRAYAHEQEIRNAAYAASASYQRARALAAEFAPAPAPAATGVPPVAGDDLSRRIADAIADRRLCTGMTLDDAIRAMGAPPVRVDSVGNINHYRWPVRGRSGTVTEWHRDSFGRRYAVDVPQYGTVGYWNATLIDGRTTEVTYSRY